MDRFLYYLNFLSGLSGLSGVFGIIFGIISHLNNKNKVAKDFFESTDRDDFRKSRGELYKLIETKDKISTKNEHLRKYIAHYDFWGMMLKKRFLPFWVFEGMAGKKLYYTMKIIDNKKILDQFNNDNGDFFPIHYEYLFNRLKKYYEQTK